MDGGKKQNYAFKKQGEFSYSTIDIIVKEKIN